MFTSFAHHVTLTLGEKKHGFDVLAIRTDYAKERTHVLTRGQELEGVEQAEASGLGRERRVQVKEVAVMSTELEAYVGCGLHERGLVRGLGFALDLVRDGIHACEHGMAEREYRLERLDPNELVSAVATWLMSALSAEGREALENTAGELNAARFPRLRWDRHRVRAGDARISRGRGG